MRYLPIFLLLLVSCITENISLENDPIIQKHFVENEIILLSSLLNYFDNEVLDMSKKKQINSAYVSIIEMVKDTSESKFNYVHLDEMNTLKLDSVLKTFPDSTKREIWYWYDSINSYTKDTTFVFDIHPNGKYGSFLEAAGKKSSFVKEYYEDFPIAAASTPTMHVNMILNADKLNLRLERERLIYAIHFVSILRAGMGNEI